MIKIKNKELKKPIFQGGMGVGVSLSGLAGAVAKAGLHAPIFQLKRLVQVLVPPQIDPSLPWRLQQF